MSYRPGTKDFVVATDTDTSFAVRFHQRGPQLPVDTLSPGEFIIFEGAVWPVFSNTASCGHRPWIRAGARLRQLLRPASRPRRPANW